MIAVASSLTEQVLNGSVLLSFPISIVAGLVAFLSPCVLPLVPAYLSYITGLTGLELTAKAARGRILWGTVLFILGFSTVLSLMERFLVEPEVFCWNNKVWLQRY